MRVLFSSPGVGELLVSLPALRSLERRCHESMKSQTELFEVFDDETVLRIVPLGAQLSGCVSIFVDAFSRRGSVFEATKKFGLTRREAEVLKLILRAKTNAEIAETLCLAESTVGDHAKSLMRKLNASKRVEIVSRVFNLEHDIADERAEHA